jgi:hypothetical protein
MADIKIIENEYVRKNQQRIIISERKFGEGNDKYSGENTERLGARGEKYRCIDVEGEIMKDIEKAFGKKTRRVDATSVHWKVGQQRKVQETKQ